MNRLIVPPLPAASRPSKTMTTRWPVSFTHAWSFSSSTWSWYFCASYVLRRMRFRYGYDAVAPARRPARRRSSSGASPYIGSSWASRTARTTLRSSADVPASTASSQRATSTCSPWSAWASTSGTEFTSVPVDPPIASVDLVLLDAAAIERGSRVSRRRRSRALVFGRAGHPPNLLAGRGPPGGCRGGISRQPGDGNPGRLADTVNVPACVGRHQGRGPDSLPLAGVGSTADVTNGPGSGAADTSRSMRLPVGHPARRRQSHGTACGDREHIRGRVRPASRDRAPDPPLQTTADGRIADVKAIDLQGVSKHYQSGAGIVRDYPRCRGGRGGVRVPGAERGREVHDDPADHGPDPPRCGHDRGARPRRPPERGAPCDLASATSSGELSLYEQMTGRELLDHLRRAPRRACSRPHCGRARRAAQPRSSPTDPGALEGEQAEDRSGPGADGPPRGRDL